VGGGGGGGGGVVMGDGSALTHGNTSAAVLAVTNRGMVAGFEQGNTNNACTLHDTTLQRPEQLYLLDTPVLLATPLLLQTW